MGSALYVIMSNSWQTLAVCPISKEEDYVSAAGVGGNQILVYYLEFTLDFLLLNCYHKIFGQATCTC
jgi:hypothetical protein